jgi:PHD/YefM family antitoxin component YafN of YafNO toxin-antitoxin module
MTKEEEQSKTLSMTELNRFASSSVRSLIDTNQSIVVTRHNKPCAVILPEKAYQELVSKAMLQPESDQPSFTPLQKPERESPRPYPELTLRLPMDGRADWSSRQLSALLTALLNNMERVNTDEECPVSDSGRCP